MRHGGYTVGKGMSPCHCGGKQMPSSPSFRACGVSSAVHLLVLCLPPIKLAPILSYSV